MSSHVPATNIVRHWSPPNGNFVKINVDGAVNLLIGFRDCKSNGASFCHFGNGCQRDYYESSNL
ncbi:unnamed protein product [Prunus armeniaca]